MKHLLSIFIFLVLLAPYTHGQTFNWGNSKDSTRHIVSANLGWEYAAIVGANYSYKLQFKRLIYLQTGISVPIGNNVLDDFKFNLGLSGLVVTKNNFNSVLTINGIYKGYSSELVRLNNLGFDIKTINGLYKINWFVSTELGLDLGLSTHFNHSESYKQLIYAEVEDGWSKPISAGIMNIGLQGGYSFKKSDLVFRIGFYKSTTSSFNVLIPYYTTLGYNFIVK